MNSKKNDYAVRVATRTGRMTQEPLYPEGHPERIEQDSQRNNIDVPSSSKKKKKKNDRTVQTSSEPIAESPDNPNDISCSLPDCVSASYKEISFGLSGGSAIGSPEVCIVLSFFFFFFLEELGASILFL